MAYRQHADDSYHGRNHWYGNGYRRTYNQHSTRFTSTSDSYQEPHVFLDLRNYYSSAESRNDNRMYRGRNDYHDRQSYRRNSDYIHPHSISRSEQSRLDYISGTPVSGRYHTPSLGSDRYTNRRSEVAEYVPPWDKSDYQMIKEASWDDQKHFMNIHGLSIHKPGDFEEAEKILDGYRWADAQAASRDTYESDSASYNNENHSRYREEDDRYDEYGSDFIGSYGDEEGIESGKEGFSSDNSDPAETDDSYEASHIRDSNERQEYFDGAGGDDDFSDYDSTDAIDYNSDSNRGEDEDMGSGDYVSDESDDDYDENDY